MLSVPVCIRSICAAEGIRADAAAIIPTIAAERIRPVMRAIAIAGGFGIAAEGIRADARAIIPAIATE